MRKRLKNGIAQITAAVGKRGGPASYRRAVEGAPVALHRPNAEDAAWSFLYKADSRYSRAPEPSAEAPEATGPREGPVQGPLLTAPVWTWEVPAYFWLGGIASGASFAAFGCELSDDWRSALVARGVAVTAFSAGPPLLISDLGRPGRFLNMLRIFKPRSPMSMGVWSLMCTGASSVAALTGDLSGRRGLARGAGALNAFFSTYLGSYTGALLASTAVPLWSRSRFVLGPLFALTSVATGAAAVRAALALTHPNTPEATHRALATTQTGALAVELTLSQLHERRLGPFASALHTGRAGRFMRAGKLCAIAALACETYARRHRRARIAAAGFCLGAGLCARYGWVAAGQASATDDTLAAQAARATR